MDQAILVTFSGITIVFTALVLMVFIITLFGLIFNRPKKKKEVEVKQEQVQVQVQKPVVQETVQEQEVDEDFIPGEVIAAIAAAVYEIGNQDGKTYVVKKVRRERTARPAWACAGIADNTRPF